MNSGLKTYIVDSFADQAFKGNPAGVCLVEREIGNDQMQLIAQELNLSETAFVSESLRKDVRSKGLEYGIRYFSPKMEIPLCGHATLASAKVLFEATGAAELKFVTFEQLELSVRSVGDQIEMVFPVYEISEASAPATLLGALGIETVNFCGYNEETNILMLEISDATRLAGLTPDFNALIGSHNSINGVLVTSVSDDEFDFHSRYFWPWSGGNEDPVTGGTHTFLAKYWGDKLSKSVMRSFQCSERTGQMEVELVESDKLLIRGNAVVFLEGTIR